LTNLPAPFEDAITIQIANWLRVALPLGCGIPWTHFPAGELRNKKIGSKLRRMGTIRGWPDFQFLYQGLFIGIEIKRPPSRSNRRGVQTDDQKKLQLQISGQGGAYHIAYSGKDVEDHLRMHGVPLRARFM